MKLTKDQMSCLKTAILKLLIREQTAVSFDVLCDAVQKECTNYDIKFPKSRLDIYDVLYELNCFVVTDAASATICLPQPFGPRERYRTVKEVFIDGKWVDAYIRKSS